MRIPEFFELAIKEVDPMKLNKFLLAACIMSLLGTLAVYPSLPEIIPTHWGPSGKVDGWGAKSSALWLSLLPLGVYILMVLLPRLDPKRESFLEHRSAYTATQFVLVLFLIAIHWATVGVALGYPIDITLVVTVGVGLLFLVIGAALKQVRPNYTFGIRTPWALANEEVWVKTHHFSSYAFRAVGILAMLTGLLPSSLRFIIFLGLILGSVLVIYIYSYLVFRSYQLKK